MQIGCRPSSCGAMRWSCGRGRSTRRSSCAMSAPRTLASSCACRRGLLPTLHPSDVPLALHHLNAQFCWRGCCIMTLSCTSIHHSPCTVPDLHTRAWRVTWSHPVSQALSGCACTPDARLSVHNSFSDCLACAQMGAGARAQGIVTQATDVKPLLTVATYLDDASGFEVYQEVAGKTFQPLEAAPAAVARASGGTSTLQLQTRGSKFVRFQEMKLQERALEVRARASRPR